MKIRILPEAESDLARAADFYDAQRDGAGDYFIACLATSSGIGIPEKTASLSSSTRRSTILNDFVIRVVASITNQSRNRPRHSASRAVASPSAGRAPG
jgi:hypothetical protein